MLLTRFMVRAKDMTADNEWAMQFVVPHLNTGDYAKRSVNPCGIPSESKRNHPHARTRRERRPDSIKDSRLSHA